MQVEYAVVTKAGRILSRHASNLRDLFSDLQNDGHTAVFVQTMEEYQADMKELRKEIEEERKTA